MEAFATNILVWIAIAIVALLLVVVIRKLERLSKSVAAAGHRLAPTAAPSLPPVSSGTPVANKMASAIIIDQGAGPALSVRVLTENCASALSASERVDSPLARHALASLPSLLPNLVLTQQLAATNLMEVVIRGDLVRAADGVGWRAFSVGQDGISQQARLLDPSGINALASGVLAFQLASFLVGQKHMVDINRQLKAIDQKLSEVKGLLRAERRAEIDASLKYAMDALHAAQRGELLPSIRLELDRLEYRLAVVLHSIRSDAQQVLARPLGSSTIGSENEYTDLRKKLSEQRILFEEMSACIEVRQACCYVASLFPGSRELLDRRLARLRDDIDDFAALWRDAKRSLQQETKQINSSWAPETAADRRREISGDVTQFAKSIEIERDRHSRVHDKTISAIAEASKEQVLYVTVEERLVKSVHRRLHGVEALR